MWPWLRPIAAIFTRGGRACAAGDGAEAGCAGAVDCAAARLALATIAAPAIEDIRNWRRPAESFVMLVLLLGRCRGRGLERRDLPLDDVVERRLVAHVRGVVLLHRSQEGHA